MFDLSDKHILVTGASSGMGKVFCGMASQCGARLSMLARNEERLKETLSSLNGDGNKSYVCDLTNEDQLKETASKITDLDGIALFAGINEFLPIKFIKQEKINSIFQTNFFSQILLIKYLLKKKCINKEASIVFISSISSVLGVPGTLLYASSKGAINSAVRVLASELAPSKIRVNAILPGIVRTPMINNTNISQETFEEQEKLYPLGLGTPEDVGNAVLFHLSDESRWLTGNLMILDGGFTLR